MRSHFVLVSLVLMGCVPSELPPSLVCAAIGTESTLKLKVSSKEALPPDIGVSLNRETVSAEENCSSTIGSQIRFSADRKEAYFTLPLSNNDNNYFPNYAETPQSEHAEFHLYKKSSCEASKESLVTRENIVVTWKKASDFSPDCDSKAYHGASEFTYNP